MPHDQQTLLLAVTGATPAVITETLYGIDKRGDQWPRQLKIITTAYGKQKAWQGLYEQGYLNQLCVDLNKPKIKFTEEDILVVPNNQGQPVEDARTEEDHEALADFIMSTVRDLTSDKYTRIHASIAGGRKTMTFYLGYAMSLFGRHFDVLSHVLISEKHENLPGFFYPTNQDVWLQNLKKEPINAKDAKVMLADIPFIRQRDFIPKLLKEVARGTGTGKQFSFHELVTLLNLGNQPDDLILEVMPQQGLLHVYAQPRKKLVAEINVRNKFYWAFYLLFVEDSIKSPEDREGYKRPTNKKNKKEDDKGADNAIETLTLVLLLKVAELYHIEVPNSCKNAKELCAYLRENLEGVDETSPYTVQTINALQAGMNGDQFSSYISRLQEIFQEYLPATLVERIIPKQAYSQDGYPLQDPSKARGKSYGIPLPDPQNQIIIIND